MRGLLTKDLRLMIVQKKFFFMMLIFASMFMVSMDNPSFIIGYFTLICSFFSISTISYDEINHGYTFLFTLPINKKQYVCSKYVFAIITSFLSWILSISVSFGYQAITHTFIYSLDIFISYIIILLIAIITLSIMLPVKLKFGSENGNIVQLIIFGIIFVGGILLSNFFGFDLIIRFFNQLNILSILLMILIIATILLLISYIISLQIMNKKEF